jgi:hypothetical protein
MLDWLLKMLFLRNNLHTLKIYSLSLLCLDLILSPKTVSIRMILKNSRKIFSIKSIKNSIGHLMLCRMIFNLLVEKRFRFSSSEEPDLMIVIISQALQLVILLTRI